MGQAGAQREPSMEEILASIRKIIENNDHSEPAAALLEPTEFEPMAETPDAAGAPDDAEDDLDIEAARSVEMARSGRAPADRAEPGLHGDGDGTPLSLADIAAQMRSGAGADQGRIIEEAVADELRGMFGGAIEAERADSEAEEAGLKEVAAALEEMDAELRAGEEAPVSAAPTEPRQRSDPDTEPAALQGSAAARTADVIEDAEGTISAGDGVRGQLISIGAGAKVAQSFAALDAAVTAGPRRSFDEIAEEILRPMLQSWLDDNLPTLVERLVREEIERVARGSRR